MIKQILARICSHTLPTAVAIMLQVQMLPIELRSLHNTAQQLHTDALNNSALWASQNEADKKNWAFLHKLHALSGATICAHILL